MGQLPRSVAGRAAGVVAAGRVAVDRVPLLALLNASLPPRRRKADSAAVVAIRVALAPARQAPVAMKVACSRA